MEKEVKIKKNRTKILFRVVIILLLAVLILFLFYSLFYDTEPTCNVKMEFVKMSNCSDECVLNCVIEGFPEDREHQSFGEKIYVHDEDDGVIRETLCICQCYGCKD